VMKGYGAERIGVFGSYVEDGQRPGNDVLVEFEMGRKTFDDYMELKFSLEGLLKNKVDLMISGSMRPELKPLHTERCRICSGILKHI